MLDKTYEAFAKNQADEEAAVHAASVMARLWCPVPKTHEFPTVADWGEGFQRMRVRFGRSSGPLPVRLVEEAESLFVDLMTSSDTPVLLHGDLHHGNILKSAHTDWLAIDPKGLVGEPAYEAGAFLRNPLPSLLQTAHPERIQARRITIFSEMLAIDSARLRGWALAQCVLSAWWMIEDNEPDWQPTIACAQTLAALPETL